MHLVLINHLNFKSMIFFIKKRLKFKYVYDNIKANYMFSPLINILVSF